MQGSTLVHDLRKLITLVDMLRDIGLDKKLSLPKVVVLGNQSSGKSSLLEQIVGLDFLPRGSGVVTRRPLELRMNNIEKLKDPYAEFDEIIENNKKKIFRNFSEVKKSIEDLTDKICGSKKNIIDRPIVLNFFSSTCPNLTIVDLPGITSNPVGDQPANIYEITKDMALRYIRQERSIILCVIPANQDLSTSQALKIMMQVDPEGKRSIGCLTKIDIMDRGNDATKILKNLEIPLRYGYVGIKCRSQEDINNKVPVSQSIKQETKFFTKSSVYSSLSPENFGTESLTKKLTSILYQQIKSSMPDIFDEIRKKRIEAEEQLEKLGPGIANTDEQMVNYAWKSISLFLKIFKNSMSGIKSNQLDTDPVSSKIREELTSLYKDENDELATENVTDKDIIKAMTNFPGSTIPGFPSIDAFLALLIPLMKKLQSPAISINNQIHDLMKKQADEIIKKVMVEKYPQFRNKFIQLVYHVLQKFRKELSIFLTHLLDAQLNYLYTNDHKYLSGSFSMTQKEQKKIKDGKIKDPLIFQLRKRIDAYYKLVVRNLRDLVPKQVFYFLTYKAIRQLQFQAFQFTSDVKQLFEWLTEPSDISRRRNECLKSIKVFEESEKKIRMDPEISKLIKNPGRQSKYYKKFGMKSPEEKQEEERIKRKQYIDQTYKANKPPQIPKRTVEDQPKLHQTNGLLLGSNQTNNAQKVKHKNQKQNNSNQNTNSKTGASQSTNPSIEQKKFENFFGSKVQINEQTVNSPQPPTKKNDDPKNKPTDDSIPKSDDKQTKTSDDPKKKNEKNSLNKLFGV